MADAATRILLVEDQEREAAAVARWLTTKRSASVVVASTGTGAMVELDAARFDLVISDFTLPDLDGIDVLIAARARQPTAVRAMLTGRFDRDLVHRAGLLRAAFMNKPVPTNLLAEIVTQAEERRAAFAALPEYIDRKADEWNLTPTQRAVLQWIAALRTREDYCPAFGVNAATFDKHVKDLRARVPGHDRITTVVHRLLLDLIEGRAATTVK